MSSKTRKEYYKNWRLANPRRYAVTKAAYVKKRNVDHAIFISKLKLERGCVDCGYKQYAVALDFDHVRGTKLFAITAAAMRSKARLAEELVKCEVRCANCHRIRTAERRANG